MMLHDFHIYLALFCHLVNGNIEEYANFYATLLVYAYLSNLL